MRDLAAYIGVVGQLRAELERLVLRSAPTILSSPPTRVRRGSFS